MPVIVPAGKEPNPMDRMMGLLWAEALESGRYARQTRGALTRLEPATAGGDIQRADCCLGVWMDIAWNQGACAGGQRIITCDAPGEECRYIYTYAMEGAPETKDGTLTPAAQRLLGVMGSNPTLQIPPELQKDGVKTAAATTLNDDYRFTFAQIARCIRYTLEREAHGEVAP